MSMIQTFTTPTAPRSSGRRMIALTLLLSSLAGYSPADNASSRVPEAWPFNGHSAWIYDTLNKPGEPKLLDPGFFVSQIQRYNRQAGPEHRLRAIYSYYGSLEMYCPAGDVRACQPDKLLLSTARTPGAEDSSVAVYRRGLGQAGSGAGKTGAEDIMSVAVIDGVVNGDYEGSLKGLNELPQSLAEGFAEKVAEQVCADPNIDGVQFDLEPFNVESDNGQYYFYRKIAALFASDEKGCRSDTHPRGRFFSVFAPVRSLSPVGSSAGRVNEVLTLARNGYFIAPLYDLASTPAGQITTPTDYQRLARAQLTNLHNWSQRAGVPFKIGIPAAASVHEFVDCRGGICRNQAHWPRSQLDYIQALFAAMDSVGIRDNPFFVGNAVWTWSRGVQYAGAGFYPEKPSAEMLRFLSENL